MKRLALVAAVLVIAACTTKEGTTDTAKDTAALAPAPAMSDSAHMDSTMKHDSSMMKDSTTKTTTTTTTTTTTKKP
jgi:hypothetical protein